MIRRRGSIEIGRPHGRLAAVVAPWAFAAFVGVWLRSAPFAVIVLGALAAGIAALLATRGSVEFGPSSVVVRRRIPGRQPLVIPVVDVAAVALSERYPSAAPVLLRHDGSVVVLSPLGVDVRFGGWRSAAARVQEIADLLAVEVVPSEDLPPHRMSLGRQLLWLGVVAALGLAAMLGVGWFVGEERFPLVATEGFHESPAVVELAGDTTYGIWGGPLVDAITVFDAGAEPVAVELVPWLDIYDHRGPASAEFVGRVRIEEGGRYRVEVVDGDAAVAFGDLPLLAELAESENDTVRFSIGQDPRAPGRRRSGELSRFAWLAAALGLVLGGVLVLQSRNRATSSSGLR